jgi:3-deoxy-7-phosphoheptulonate synthase
VVWAGGAGIGGPRPVLVGSIGALSDPDALAAAALDLAKHGGALLHWGTLDALRPSPRPDRTLLRRLREVADVHGLALAAEVGAAEDAAAARDAAHLLHVPAALMQSYELLKAIGRAGGPALLSRGLGSTLLEWLLAAEYLLLCGSSGVVFCEGGIRTLEPDRPILDLAAIAALSHRHRLPVLAAPGRAAPGPDLIEPLARAALAAGAHGLLVELDVAGGAP